MGMRLLLCEMYSSGKGIVLWSTISCNSCLPHDAVPFFSMHGLMQSGLQWLLLCWWDVCSKEKTVKAPRKLVNPLWLQDGGEKFSGFQCGTQGGEMLLTLAVDWRASVVRGEEAGRFHEVAGVSIIAVGGPRLTLYCRQPSGLRSKHALCIHSCRNHKHTHVT